MSAPADALVPARICVIGAGAIGGLLGVQLSLRGHIVTFHARGAHLAAMQANASLSLISPDSSISMSAPSSTFIPTSSLTDLPPQDYIILGLKTHQISSVLPELKSLLSASPNATLLVTQNGIPWWFFQQSPSCPESLKNRALPSVDPGAVLHAGIDPSRILATVVYPAAHVSSPGVIKHTDGVRFPVGEPSGAVDTPRVLRLSAMLIDAGFKAPILPDVRGEIWLKLWGSVAFNPLSVLTHATLVDLCENPKSRRVVEAMMGEVEQVARAVGVTMRVPMERRINGAAKVGRHKTSTLQDVEAGRPMEIEAIMGAVIEIARLTETPIPHVDAVYGTVSALADVLRESGAILKLETR